MAKRPSVAVASSVQKDTLTLSQIINLDRGIGSLSSRIVVINEGGVDKAVETDYSLSGETRLTLAQNLEALAPHLRSIETTNRALLAETEKELPIAKDERRDEWRGRISRALTEKLQPVLEAEVSVTLNKLNARDLRIDENQISPIILTWLLPMLKP